MPGPHCGREREREHKVLGVYAVFLVNPVRHGSKQTLRVDTPDSVLAEEKKKFITRPDAMVNQMVARGHLNHLHEA